MRRDMKMTEMQRAYWNGLSEEYQRITHIALDDFHYGPQIPGERTLRLLPEFAPGTTSLELGCGAAQNSVWLARRGMVCTACDISAEQLGAARRIASEAGVDIRLVETTLEDFSKTVDGEFDFVHSSHALEFVEKPGRIVLEMARHVKPGGYLMISTVHPVYQGEWMDGTYEEEDGTPGEDSGWGVFLTSYFSPPDDIRRDGEGRPVVVSRAYPVSSWFKWLRAAGLEVVSLEEPAGVFGAAAKGVVPYTSDAWGEADGELQSVPGTVIFLARKNV